LSQPIPNSDQHPQVLLSVYTRSTPVEVANLLKVDFESLSIHVGMWPVVLNGLMQLEKCLAGKMDCLFPEVTTRLCNGRTLLWQHASYKFKVGTLCTI